MKRKRRYQKVRCEGVKTTHCYQLHDIEKRTVTGASVGKLVGFGVGDWVGLDEGWRRRRV